MAQMESDPLGMLPPIETVLYSSEEPSVTESESTFTALPGRVSTRSDQDSLNALLLRFTELNDRVDLSQDVNSQKLGNGEETKRKNQRPSKRQRRAAANKRDQGFEGLLP